MPRPATGRTSRARTCVLLALAVALVLPLSACRGAAAPGSGSPDSTGSSAGLVQYDNPDQVALTSDPVATRTRIHRVYGRLPDARRKAVRRDIGRIVDRWWEAAYLGGAYPRTDFPDAFPGFTRGAERLARSDQALLTNRRGGARITSVTPRRRSVSIDIIAVGGQPRSVTAHFVLRFATTGATAGTTTVRGRLFLTRRSGPWRVFGYDVAKGSRP